jgi:site-specific recombinase XerD
MSYNLTRRSNGIWMVDFEDRDGRRKRLSTGQRDHAEAKTKAREMYLDHMEGRASVAERTPMDPERFTLADAFARMFKREWHPTTVSSHGSIKSDVAQINAVIGETPIEDVDYHVIERFIDEQKAGGLSTGTIGKRVSRISTTLRMCCIWQDPKTGLPYIRAVPPMPRTGSAGVRHRVLEVDEERAIKVVIFDFIHGIRPSRRPATLWGLFWWYLQWLHDTGMRRNEALAVSRNDIEDGVVYLAAEDTKTNERRGIPLTARLTKLVGVFDAMGVGGLLFGNSLTPGKVHEMWHEACDAAGVSGVTIHDLRRTRGTRLRRSGVSIENIATLLGHRDHKVTFRVYAHIPTDDLKQVVTEAETAWAKLVGDKGWSIS